MSPRSLNFPERAPVATVIVPVRNSASQLARCLAGLARQNVPLEVLVVDDGSTDSSAEVPESWGARVLQAGGRGAAAARNVGIAAATAEFILFTDADCIPTPGWAKSLLTPLLEGEAIATKGTYRSRQRRSTPRFVQLEYEERYVRMRGYDHIDFLDTYSLGVHRDTLVAAGGFDEAFAGASVEDQEMSFRLREHGRFLFVPEAVVEHQHAETPWAYFRKKLRIGQGKATIWRRHRDCLRGDSHTPRALRWQVPLVALSLAVAALASVWPWAGIPAGLLALSPLALSSALLGRVREVGGIGLALPAAFLCVGRGWALTLGFLLGLIRPLARLQTQPTVTPQPEATPAVTSLTPELPGLEADAPEVVEVEEARDVVHLGS